VSPFIDALKRLRSLIERLRQTGVHIRYLDLAAGSALFTIRKRRRSLMNMQGNPAKLKTSTAL